MRTIGIVALALSLVGGAGLARDGPTCPTRAPGVPTGVFTGMLVLCVAAAAALIALRL